MIPAAPNDRLHWIPDSTQSDDEILGAEIAVHRILRCHLNHTFPLFTTLRSFVEKMKVFWALDEKCVLALSEQS